MYRKIFNFIKQYILYFPLTAVISLSACSHHGKQYDYSIFAFGTLIDITLYDVTENQAVTAFEQLQQDFDRYHQNWSPWTNGDLAQLNKKLNSQTTIQVPEHLIPLIKTSMDLSQRSHDYYNPAIGKLINLWQFHNYQKNDIQPPDDSEIQRLIKNNPSLDDLHFIDKNQLVNKNPAVSLNFGAFAKGYAIALSIKRLQNLNIQNAVINAGGDLSIIGQHGNRPWNIGIQHPREDNILASIEVKGNESVFTSGDYERFYFYQAKRYHHILDPRTGYPTQDTQSVTVIHKNAGLADAAATALFVAGSKNWHIIAKNLGISHVMLIDAHGNIHMTPKHGKTTKIPY